MLTLNSRRRAAVAIALISVALTSHAATDPLANSSAVVFRNGVQAAAISATTAVPANPDGNSEIAFVPLQLNTDGRYAFGARVNVTRAAGAQFASGIAVNPTNRNNIVVVGSSTEVLFDARVEQDVIVAVSRDGGQTFTPRTVFGFGSPPAVTFDDFGNCYVAYRDRQDAGQPVLRILASSDGCANFVPVASANVGLFASLTSAGAGVFASAGSSDSLVYVPATGLGAFGAASRRPVAALTPFTQALATGPNDQFVGQVVHARTQRNPAPAEFSLAFTPNCSLFAEVDVDGSGTASFNAPVLVTHATCLDTLRVLIDRSNSTTRGRIYVLYIDLVGPETARQLQSLLRYSDDGGATWSTGVQLTTSTGQPLRPTGIDIDTAGRLVAVEGTQIATLPSALPRVLPDSPLNLQLQSATTGRVTLRWTDRASNETAYVVERQSPVVIDPLLGIIGLSQFEVIATLGADSTSFTDTQLTPTAQGQVFTYRVRALNNAGSSADSNILPVRASGAALAAPGNATATAVSQTQIRVDWQDLSSNETGFLIESSLDGFGFQAVAATGANITSVVVGGFQPGTFRFFRVRATVAAGPSEPSNVTFATTLDAAVSTPNAPSNLTATSARSGIALRWRDNSNNETQFEIQRGTDGVNFTTLRVVNANVTSFTDTSATARRTFFYRVRALNNPPNTTGRASTFTNVASARAR